MGKRPVQAMAYCDTAWKILSNTSNVDGDQKAPFSLACMKHAEAAERSAPADQCFWAQKNDKFVLKKKANVLVAEDVAASCLATKALEKKWVTVKEKVEVKPPKPDPTPPPTVELPGTPTTTTEEKSGFWNALATTPYSVEGSAGLRVTSMGVAVNGAGPVKSYNGGIGGMARLSAYLTPTVLGHGFRYETQIFAQGMLDNLDGPLGNLWNASAGIAPRFIYDMSTSSVVIAPEIYGGAGVYLQKDPVEVGIKNRAYFASNSYTFPLMAAGLGIYLQIPTAYKFASGKELKFEFGVRSGIRWMFHKDPVTNIPAGMPSDTTLRLTSPMLESLQGVFKVLF